MRKFKCCSKNVIQEFKAYRFYQLANQSFCFCLFQINHDNKSFALFLMFLDGMFNMLQNVFAFTVLAMVNPLSYAVANATKRVVIIGASLVLLHNPVTKANVVGMMVAIFGVLCYNWVSKVLDMSMTSRLASELWYKWL